MFIRTANERDLPAVADLIGEAAHTMFDAPYGADAVTDWLETRFSVAQLAKYVERHRSEFLVADDGSALGGVAFGAAKGDDARIVDLEALVVRPSLQGRGIGGMLLDEFEQSFFESELLQLDIAEPNARALHFFEAAGYAEIGHKPGTNIPGLLLTVQKSLV